MMKKKNILPETYLKHYLIGLEFPKREKNQTMVMVTHDNHLAGFADRIFHIIDGKIVKIEDRSEYKEDEQ